jgi:hypothetical protein
VSEFAAALHQALERDWAPLEVLKVVLKHEGDAEKVRRALR